MKKKLYRSRTDKKISGVAGGIAQYLEVDSVFVRLTFALLVFVSGAGIVLYLLCMFLIPNEPLTGTQIVDGTQNEEDKKGNSQGGKIMGAILILLGVLILFDNFLPFFDFVDFFPLVLVVLGGWLLINSINKERESSNRERESS